MLPELEIKGLAAMGKKMLRDWEFDECYNEAWIIAAEHSLDPDPYAYTSVKNHFITLYKRNLKQKSYFIVEVNDEMKIETTVENFTNLYADSVKNALNRRIAAHRTGVLIIETVFSQKFWEGLSSRKNVFLKDLREYLGIGVNKFQEGIQALRELNKRLEGI
uniref:Uncharacterized protein n=1 Tax=viral metagenome TaxID=1070528 RepID=A0A6M3K2U6_9ZZZZ